MDTQKPIKALYPNIPDHSDLRGFSYKAPTGYEWSDDHKKAAEVEKVQSTARSPERPLSLWESVRNLLKNAPKGYQRSDDRIREDICEALMNHPGIDASEIEVIVHAGLVTMRGSVPDQWMKRASEWQIDRIAGVRDIHNELKFLTN